MRNLIICFLVMMSFSFNDVYAKNQKKSFRIAVVPGLSPYVYHNDDNMLVGFDVEIGREIAKRLGYNAEYVELGFDAVIPSVMFDKADIIISAVTITSARAEKVDFSIPYLQSDKNDRILVLNENKNINSLGDLKNKKVACVTGAIQCDTLSNISGVKIVQFSNVADTYLALLNKKVDANLEPVSSNEMCMKGVCKDKVKMVGEEVPGGKIGAVVKKGNKELLEKVNKIIENMKKDGTLKKITLKYDFKYYF